MRSSNPRMHPKSATRREDPGANLARVPLPELRGQIIEFSALELTGESCCNSFGTSKPESAHCPLKRRRLY